MSPIPCWSEKANLMVLHAPGRGSWGVRRSRAGRGATWECLHLGDGLASDLYQGGFCDPLRARRRCESLLVGAIRRSPRTVRDHLICVAGGASPDAALFRYLWEGLDLSDHDRIKGYRQAWTALSRLAGDSPPGEMTLPAPSHCTPLLRRLAGEALESPPLLGILHDYCLDHDHGATLRDVRSCCDLLIESRRVRWALGNLIPPESAELPPGISDEVL